MRHHFRNGSEDLGDGHGPGSARRPRANPAADRQGAILQNHMSHLNRCQIIKPAAEMTAGLPGAAGALRTRQKRFCNAGGLSKVWPC
jgi:hypothetical protein